MRIVSGKLDFVKTLDSMSVFECGMKVSSVAIGNDYVLERQDSSGNYFTDTQFSSKYNYAEENYAVYAVYSRAWERINVQLGMRAEETILDHKTRTTISD